MKITFFLLLISFFAATSYGMDKPINESEINSYKSIANRIQNEFNSKKWMYSDETYRYLITKKDLLEETLDYYKNNTKNFRSIALLEYFYGHIMYSYEENIPKSIPHFKNAYKLEIFLKTDEKFALYNSWANAEKMNNNYINSVIIFNKSLTLAKIKNNDFEIVRNNIGLGMIQRDVGLLNQSEQSFMAAKKIVEKKNYSSQIDKYWIWLHLGKLYRLKKQYVKSIKYLNSIKKTKERIDYIRGFFESEKAMYFYETNQIDSSSYYCKKLLNTKSKSFSRYNLITANFIYGQNCRKTNKLQSAIYYFKKNIELTKEYGADDEGQQTAVQLLQIIENDNKLSRTYLKYLLNLKAKREKTIKKSKLFIIQLDNIKKKETLLEHKQNNSSIYILAIVIVSTIALIIIYRFKKVITNQQKINKENLKLDELNKQHKQYNLQLSLINSSLEQFSSILAHDVKSSIVTINYLSKDYQKLNTRNSKEMKTVEVESQNLYKYIDQLVKKN